MCVCVYRWPDPRYWLLTLLLLPVVTLFGNALVCLSVATERGLHTATNYFIVSLAIADIMVAILVMPLAVYVEVRFHLLTTPSGKQWRVQRFAVGGQWRSWGRRTIYYRAEPNRPWLNCNSYTLSGTSLEPKNNQWEAMATHGPLEPPLRKRRGVCPRTKDIEAQGI